MDALALGQGQAPDPLVALAHCAGQAPVEVVAEAPAEHRDHQVVGEGPLAGALEVEQRRHLAGGVPKHVVAKQVAMGEPGGKARLPDRLRRSQRLEQGGHHRGETGVAARLDVQQTRLQVTELESALLGDLGAAGLVHAREGFPDPGGVRRGHPRLAAHRPVAPGEKRCGLATHDRDQGPVRPSQRGRRGHGRLREPLEHRRFPPGPLEISLLVEPQEHPPPLAHEGVVRVHASPGNSLDSLGQS